ncbi:MAG: hypothetical protein SWH61_14165 [Thermodesulfobacteriota bacterium]|nr:hypothetical protein [Thermodesulfobacteriota bacterium]
MQKKLHACMYFCLIAFFANITPTAFATTLSENSVKLGTASKSEKIYAQSLKISDDKQHIAYVSKNKTGMRVWKDGTPGPVYQGISIETPVFAPGSDKVCYIAIEANQMRAVIDGEKGPVFQAIDSLTFSYDGTRTGYRYINNAEKMQVMIDNKPGPEFAKIADEPGIVFSPDGKHFAYVGISSTGSHILVKNHKKQQAFDDIQTVLFSPDARHLAIVAKQADMWHVIFDGKTGNPYKKITQLSFSPDSNHIVYTAQKQKQFVVVKDHNELPSGQSALSPQYSPDGKTLVYAMGKNNKWHLVVNGKAGPPVEKPGKIGFSEKGSHFAYSALMDDQWTVFFDNKKGPLFDNITYLDFSPYDPTLVYIAHKKDHQCIVKNQIPDVFYDSVGLPVFSGKPNGHFAYVALDTQQHKTFIIENIAGSTKKHEPFDMIGILMADKKGDPFYAAQRPFFSADGRHMAYPVIHNKKSLMVVDNKPQKRFDVVSRPYFSPDGTHVAYMAKTNDRWFVVVDGKTGKKSFDSFLKEGGIVFDGPDRFSVLALNLPGPDFYRLTVNIKSN